MYTRILSNLYTAFNESRGHPIERESYVKALSDPDEVQSVGGLKPVVQGLKRWDNAAM